MAAATRSQNTAERKAEVQMYRQGIIGYVDKLMAAENLSQNEACKRAGVSAANVHRWRKQPAPKWQACGRKAKFQLSDIERDTLRRLRLKKGSIALAIEFFVKEPACTHETREGIYAVLDAAARKRRPPVWPRSLKLAATVTQEEEALFRGEKAFINVEHTDRRGMFWTDAQGVEREMDAYTIFESDDMSTNEPFSYTDPETGQPALGRQVLISQSVYSAAFLGATPLGRERDAYRVEDIADHLLDVVLSQGLPHIWRLERGVWENKFLQGVEIGKNAEGQPIYWGGLEPLFHIDHAFKSKQKGTIEGSFNLLQSIGAHESTSIGRTRGEFEQQTKDYLKARRTGHVEKFWPIGEYADALVAHMQHFNSRLKQRRAFGRETVIPEELMRNGVKRECPEDQLWRFCPIKKQLTVRGGHVETSVPHYPLPFRFRVNGDTDHYFNHGSRVLLAFHPGRPHEGCHIFNAEAPGEHNRNGLGIGEYLLTAPLAADAPQIDLSNQQDNAIQARKRANAAVRREFRAIMATGQRGRRVSHSQTGYGDSTTEERNTTRTQSSKPNSDKSRVKTKKTKTREVDTDLEMERLEALEAAAAKRGEILTI